MLVKEQTLYTRASQLIYDIVGAAMEVHNQLGKGFLEEVYQEAMELELAERGIPFKSQVKIPVFYKGRPMQKFYIADLVCYDEIVVELKAVSALNSSHVAQTVNYLKAMQLTDGIVINFGTSKLERRHCVFNEK